MTICLTVRNVNHAFYNLWWKMSAYGTREMSRNGPVLVAPGPFITEYTHPVERVLFNPKRDANPVFHLMEACWMLAGGKNVSWLSQFSSNIANYAEDDGQIHGAYGHRWRHHFDLDQLYAVIDILKRDPDSRQAVIQMWDPTVDLIGNWKDRPCNTAIYFDTRMGRGGKRRLNMTVTCRSNDAYWGAYGANAVHFSFLQEALASAIGVEVGLYRQFSNNFHLYTDLPAVKSFLEIPPYDANDPYSHREVRPLPLLRVESGETFEDLIEDCEKLVNGWQGFSTEFIGTVARPMRDAYLDRKAKTPYSLDEIADCDWKVAFSEWIKRREDRKDSHEIP